MIKYINLNGTIYQEVEIPIWMTASKLIADHLDRGDKFVLDSSGTLQVLPRKLLAFSEEVVQSPAPAPETPPVDVQYYRNKLREIARIAKGE